MKFQEDKILAQLEKIVTDKSFSRSKINVRLLHFLVHSTLQGNEIKELTIGLEFFGSKYDPIKLDNKVRVYIYHLRKKLDQYYSQPTATSDIVFHIAKGQYKVSFNPPTPLPRPIKKRPTKALLLGGMVLLAVLALLLYTKPINAFWKTLMQNNLSTSVIFGDYFTIEGPITTSRIGIMRDYEINSNEELQQYIVTHPQHKDKLRPSRHHYFNWMAPYCSRNITEFWGQYAYPFEIIQISEWSPSQLEKENLVYFGQSKSMGVLKNILVESFPQYQYKSQQLERTDPITHQKTVYTDIISYNNKITDYTIVAKITLPKGNEMRFFLSDQDCGAISALQYFTQNDSVQAFYTRHNIATNQDFIALFKVTGWQRKSYEMEFIQLDRK